MECSLNTVVVLVVASKKTNAVTAASIWLSYIPSLTTNSLSYVCEGLLSSMYAISTSTIYSLGAVFIDNSSSSSSSSSSMIDIVVDISGVGTLGITANTNIIQA